MTNKELAAQCLIEAAELLDESAGRNGAFSREMATKDLNRLKNGETNENDTWIDRYHGGREQRLKDLEKEARTGKDYRYGKPKLRGKDYLDERSIRQASGKMSDIDVMANNVIKSKNPDLHKLINQNAELAEAKAKHKQALDVTPYSYEMLMRKSKNEKDRRLASESKNEKDGERKFNLRKRIIERFIKSKNESVDIDALLEEAMDLLDY